MKTKLALALGLVTINATAQIHTVVVDGWAVSNNQTLFQGYGLWNTDGETFKLTPFNGGYVWGWWGDQTSGEYWHSDANRVDFINLRFNHPVRPPTRYHTGTQVYAEQWTPPMWKVITAELPPSHTKFAVYRVVTRNGILQSVNLVYASPWQIDYMPLSWYEAMIP